MNFRLFGKRLLRKIKKELRQPIRVFCFHQVSDQFDPEGMWECDWISTEQFKDRITSLQREVTFISLSEAQTRLKKRGLRLKKYAVLTADDGWASLMNIIPWLNEEQIPITLFLNPLYMDGKHFQSRETEKFLTDQDVIDIVNGYGSIVSVASHGWDHRRCTAISADEFKENAIRAEDYLAKFPNKVPFFAFTFGLYTPEQVDILKTLSIIPVFVDGDANTNNSQYIHRELI